MYVSCLILVSPRGLDKSNDNLTVPCCQGRVTLMLLDENEQDVQTIRVLPHTVYKRGRQVMTRVRNQA